MCGVARDLVDISGRLSSRHDKYLDSGRLSILGMEDKTVISLQANDVDDCGMQAGYDEILVQREAAKRERCCDQDVIAPDLDAASVA